MFIVRPRSLWPVPAAVLTGLWFTAWRMVRSGRRVVQDKRDTASRLRIAGKSAVQAARNPTLRWISWCEFMNLLATCKDLIVIDLRDDPHASPVAMAEFVLPVKLHDLVEVLELVPTDKVVVFCGVSDLSMLLIETSHFMRRPAPAYVLYEDIVSLEVA